MNNIGLHLHLSHILAELPQIDLLLKHFVDFGGCPTRDFGHDEPGDEDAEGACAGEAVTNKFQNQYIILFALFF